MTKYSAKVRWSGNHYHYDDIVIGSKVKTKEDGTVWLYNDEETIYQFTGKNDRPVSFSECREVWVEVQPETVKEKDEK